ncbi:large conductance mechanosensitive channel protein MscL [Candidatus Peribacteria bacterium]|nr:large conductance mechanosensitive channel protein MscL [Candidatus Peribacteria bacterium]
MKGLQSFLLRGNVVDMAVGVVIGAAFGKIVTSLVEDVLMPVIGYYLGGASFENLFVVLGGGSYESLQAARDAGAAVLAYGSFLNTVVDFLILGTSVYVAIRAFELLQKKKEAAPAGPTTEALLTDIRDLLQR